MGEELYLWFLWRRPGFAHDLVVYCKVDHFVRSFSLEVWRPVVRSAPREEAGRPRWIVWLAWLGGPIACTMEMILGGELLDIGRGSPAVEGVGKRILNAAGSLEDQRLIAHPMPATPHHSTPHLSTPFHHRLADCPLTDDADRPTP